MIINALEFGARMSSWPIARIRARRRPGSNIIDGQQNLYDAVRRTSSS
jgi:hypothetical protein